MVSGWWGEDAQSTIKSVYPLKEGRVVFNIKGNDYRLVVKIHYDQKIVFIRFIGTHEMYDKIDAEAI